MRRVFVGGLLIALTTLLAPGSAQAQIDLGAQLSYNGEPAGAEGLDGAFGLGARVGVGLPLVGLGVMGSFDYFFPDCDPLDCTFWDLSGNVTYTLPSVAVNPYFGGGVALQSFEVDDTPDVEGGSEEEVGFNLLAGVKVGAMMPVNLFGELKYQIFGDPFDNQFVISAGIYF